MEQSPDSSSAKTIPPFKAKNLDTAINWLVYGVTIQEVNAKSLKSEDRFFYILEDEPQYLQYYPSREEFHKSRINLAAIDYVSESCPSSRFSELNERVLLVMQECDRQYIFQFRSYEEKVVWWQGLLYFIEQAKSQVR